MTSMADVHVGLRMNSCLQNALPWGHSMTQACHFVSGMKQLITNCPALGTRPEFRGIMNLKGLDVIATRLWLDQRLPTRFPANVLAGFESDVGGTFFNLTELQVSLICLHSSNLHVSLCFGYSTCRCTLLYVLRMHSLSLLAIVPVLVPVSLFLSVSVCACACASDTTPC